MWPFSKCHYQWKEPKEFRREINRMVEKNTRWWHRPFRCLALAFSVVAVLSLMELYPNVQWHLYPLEVKISLALIAGLFLTYWTMLVYAVSRVKIRVFDSGLIHSYAGYRERFKFTDILSFSIQRFLGHRAMA